MKKLFIAMLVMVFAVVGGQAMACEGPQCSDEVFGTGFFDIEANSKGGGIDYDGVNLHDGYAGGISAAGGLAHSEASGLIVNGYASGNVSTIAGGLTATEAWSKTYEFEGGQGMGVGSKSINEAVTGGSFNIHVDPNLCGAFGAAEARMFGIAGQGTLNGSIIGDQYLEGDGFTGGVAGQASVGGFYAGGHAVSGPDFYRPEIVGWNCNKYRCRPIIRMRLQDSYAGAGAEANIHMLGYSYSQSFKEVFEDGDTRYETLKTEVGAATTVNTIGNSYDYDRGLSCADANLCGGYLAGGGAATHTQLNGGNATALGAYVGGGALGTNFNGSANGYSQVQSITVDGMNGQINAASSGMQINATTSMNGNID